MDQSNNDDVVKAPPSSEDAPTGTSLVSPSVVNSQISTSRFEKTTQNVIWMPLRNIKDATDRKSLINALTEYRGHLFEEYLKELCTIFECKNEKISFVYIPPESTNDHQEVGDSILIQGEEIIIFEAKSRQ